MKPRRRFRPDLGECVLEDRLPPAISNLGVIVLTTGGYMLLIPFPGAFCPPRLARRRLRRAGGRRRERHAHQHALFCHGIGRPLECPAGQHYRLPEPRPRGTNRLDRQPDGDHPCRFGRERRGRDEHPSSYAEHDRQRPAQSAAHDRRPAVGQPLCGHLSGADLWWHHSCASPTTAARRRPAQSPAPVHRKAAPRAIHYPHIPRVSYRWYSRSSPQPVRRCLPESPRQDHSRAARRRSRPAHLQALNPPGRIRAMGNKLAMRRRA